MAQPCATGEGGTDCGSRGCNAEVLRDAPDATPQVECAGLRPSDDRRGIGGGQSDLATRRLADMLAKGWVVTGRTRRDDLQNGGYRGHLSLARNGATARVSFSGCAHILCFTPGSRVATPAGERAVETLQAGDAVFTRDGGVQQVRWTGRRDLGPCDMAIQPKWAPIRIRKGALGDDLPERDMYVSPNHRMLLTRRMARVLFGEPEVLVAAKHLTHLVGIDHIDLPEVSYVHLLFDRHEIVMADGHWTESFQPGDRALRGIGDAQRSEILRLFPELARAEGRRGYGAARKILRASEVRLLLS